MNVDIIKLKETINDADAVIIGAGAGLSTAAGFIYNGERFEKYFFDFIVKYKIKDMYSGGFSPFEDDEEFWAYWSRYIYINRYMDAPLPTYNDLFEIIKDKDYFVITTNVDHCFQKAGFDHKRLFYTQGDFGLLQCSKPCHKKTYDNKEIIEKMLLSQGFVINKDKSLSFNSKDIKMKVDKELLPVCPVCGEPMTLNLRSDDTFVEDEGWHKAADNYIQFLNRHNELKTVFLELGVGYNTPVIIKYPFISMTNKWPKATYICINPNEKYAPEGIEDKSIIINDDIKDVFNALLNKGN